MADNAGEDQIVRRIDVAVCTDRLVVRYSEPRVVESRPEPIRRDPGGMAGYTGGRVLRGNVIRHCTAKRLGAQPCRLMTSVAIRVRGGQRVIVVDVARRTRGGHMEALQRPARRAVIEFAVRPEQRIVTRRAL